MMPCCNIISSTSGLSGAIALTGCFVSALWGNCALAQIIPDDTLGAEGSQITSSDLINFQIDGGATRGTNLFHSFREVSVATGGSAHFNNTANIQNIISRVTGGSISNIDGLIRANGTANLFLFNPNGILFGPNASLNIGGSFLASTASAVNLADGSQFSATAPQTPLLLTVSVPIGLQYGGNAGSVQVQRSSLQMPTGQTLALVGGNVSLVGGSLLTPGGRVELGGVTGTGTVGLNIDGNNLSLSVPENIARTDVSLKNGAVVYVVADNGGSITINAQNLDILGGSFLVAGIEPGVGTADSQVGDITLKAKGAITVEGSNIFNLVGSEAVGNGGDITITAKSLSLTNNSLVRTDSDGRGNAGKVLVQVDESVLLAQGSTIFNTVQAGAIGNGGGITLTAGSFSLLEGAEIVANTSAEGNAGNVTVQVRDHISFDGVYSDGFASGIFDVVRPDGRGNAGNITLTAGSLSLTNGGRLQSNTRGQGNAGNITIQVRDHIFIDGIDGPLATGTPSGLYTTVGTDGVGKGGDIYVTAGSLSATNGGQLTANTFERGDAGNVTIVVRGHVSFDGVNTSTPNEPASSSGAFSGVGDRGGRIPAIGQGGDIHIMAGSLSVTNGAQLGTAITSGSQGDAGSVKIVTRETVAFDGLSSGVSTFVEPKAIGDASDINITTGVLTVSNGAQLSTIIAGEGDAGNIRVRANTLEVTKGGQFLTTTEGSSRAGDINLEVLDSITLAGADSGLFANTTESSSGNGGSIFIRNPRNVKIQDSARLAVDSQGSGEGGNIEIRAGSVTLEKKARLLAETASNTGGNITLQLKDLLRLRNESKISTNAGTDRAGGDGGNITINARNGFIVAVPKENSDITANAFTGRGGNINTTAQGIFGIEFRPRQTPLSDITASSDFGVNGVVDINTPDVDPSRGLANLPSVPVNTEIAQDCQGGRGKATSSFISTGSGGLPTNPYEPLDSRDILADVQPPTQWTSNSTGTASTSTSLKTNPNRIVEAQGWSVNEKGEVVLIAEVPQASSQWGCRLR